MKTLVQFKVFVAVLLVLAVLQTASAFYDPAPQRWINRDPIGEIGYDRSENAASDLPLLRKAHYQFTQIAAASEAFTFLNNSPMTDVDVFGLIKWRGKGGKPMFSTKPCDQSQIMKATSYCQRDHGPCSFAELCREVTINVNITMGPITFQPGVVLLAYSCRDFMDIGGKDFWGTG